MSVPLILFKLLYSADIFQNITSLMLFWNKLIPIRLNAIFLSRDRWTRYGSRHIPDSAFSDCVMYCSLMMPSMGEPGNKYFHCDTTYCKGHVQAPSTSTTYRSRLPGGGHDLSKISNGARHGSQVKIIVTNYITR